MRRRWAGLAALTATLALAGCAGPPTPRWSLESRAAAERAVAAALEGQARIEAAEFDRARAALAHSGRTDLLARVELLRCAAHTARLDLGQGCPGFDALRADATPADRAYADHLAGRSADRRADQLAAADLALLPAHHRRIAAGDATALAAIDDPLARLVSAALLLQSGRIDAAGVTLAVDTASAQGWRRALLAWLHVQRRLAEQDGDVTEVERVQRRIDLAGGVR